MELQQFVVIGGDGDKLMDGDTFTIDGIYNLSSMNRRERVAYRSSRVARWFTHLPGNISWSIYLRAQRIADWLDPDR